MRHELWTGDWGLHTGLINFPNGIDLYPIEIANGLLTAWWPISPVVAANLLAVLHVALTGVCTALLSWRVSQSRIGAHVAGALAQGSAFTAFTLHAGVGELRQAWWIPLGLAAAVTARDSLQLRAFVGVGVTIAATTLACFYHGFFLATAVAVYALCTPARSRALWLGWAAAAGAALLLAGPVVALFATSYGHGGPDQGLGFAAWVRSGLPTDSFQVTSLQPHELILPDLSLTTDLGRPFEPYLGGRYVGVLALVLAALGLAAAPRRVWPWAVVVVTGIVLALGNTLWVAGHLVQPTVILPLAVLNKVLAFVAEPLNFPVRYMAISVTALAVLGGAAARWRPVLLLVPLVLVDVTANDPVPFPRSIFPLQGLDDVRAPPGAVAELTWATSQDAVLQPHDPVSLFDASHRVRSLAAQILLNRPFQTIAIERVDHWAFDGLMWTAATPLARSLAGTPMLAADLEASVFLMRERGFGSVLMTRVCGGPRDLVTEDRLTALLGPSRHGNCGDLWLLPDRPPPPNIESFRKRFAADLANVQSPKLGKPVSVAPP